MIRISTRGRYGTRLMLYLARNYKQPVLLKKIAQEEEISEKYLEQLIPLLKSAELIKSHRGIHGGYTLAKPPSTIMIKDIIETMEGPISLVECVTNPDTCHRVSSCATRDIWQLVGEKMADSLSSLSLTDLLEIHSYKVITYPEYTI